jgi:RND family efflux transporter MFP subunit
VEVGSRVSKGQTLVEMDQTNLYNARVQLSNLKTEYNRMKILLESGSVSQQAYDQMKAQYDVALANVDNLERNTNIKAPFSGIISGKYFEAGEMYSGSPTTASGKAAIVTLVQLNPLKAMVNISEAYYPVMKSGKGVTICSELYPDKCINAKITRVYPTIDPSSHTFQVEVTIPNTSENLKPGMYCSVSIDLGKVDALMIPAQSVLKTQGSNERYVFIDDKGVARKVKVVLGQRVDDMVEVVSNDIKEGDLLVVEGQGRLNSGDKLKVVK